MGKTIEHEGIVESIDGSHIRVKIVQSSACSSCHVKSMCATSESQEKEIDIYSPLSCNYSVGERVKACGTVSMGRNAVLLAFAVPLLVIILCVVLSLYLFHQSEQMTLVAVLVSLSIYYLTVHAFRHRLSKHFSFWIEKIEK